MYKLYRMIYRLLPNFLRPSVLAKSREQIVQTQARLKDRNEKLALKNRQLKVVRSELVSANRDIDKLIGWIEELESLSYQFREQQKSTSHVYSRIDHTIRQFLEWQEDYEKASVRPESPLFNYAIDQSSTAAPTAISLARLSLSVDIVVCVHNALENLKQCLDSLMRHTRRDFTLYLVNDGSDKPTTEYMRDFASRNKCCNLIETDEAEGYTKSANKGLRASNGDYVVFLNSDTIVTEKWLSKILECGESDMKIGIVGPLSNAASWQSVPKTHDHGDWAVNPLPEHHGVDNVAELVEFVSERSFPKVPFINGFCFAIKRELVRSIGFFDEEHFPVGYGEENDYCLRAADAGFRLAVADHAYVYHAKSKSYTHERRKSIRGGSGKSLQAKHGEARISSGLELMRDNPVLKTVRNRLGAELELSIRNSSLYFESPFRILFLLPCKAGGGGVHSVIQEAQGMRDLGTFAQVAVPVKHRSNYRELYPEANRNALFFFENEGHLAEHVKNFDVAVATIFTSVRLLKQAAAKGADFIPSYYIQDYEPWFFEPGTPERDEALSSYTSIPGMLCFSKTDWLCKTVKEMHGKEVQKVVPSIDHSVYYSRVRPDNDDVVKVSAMIRPKTLRRAPEATMKVLKAIKDRYGGKVSITIFGCESYSPEFLALTRDFEFENAGALSREEVAEVLGNADIFLDLSTYQAFGRTGLEAMACGCSTVLPASGGTDEYARHRENTLLVDTDNFDEMISAASELIENSELRSSVIEAGLETASKYDIQNAARSEISLFAEIINYEKTSHEESVEGSDLYAGCNVER